MKEEKKEGKGERRRREWKTRMKRRKEPCFELCLGTNNTNDTNNISHFFSFTQAVVGCLLNIWHPFKCWQVVQSVPSKGS